MQDTKIKKILVVTRKYPPSIGGMQTYSKHLVSGLSEKAEVSLIALGYGQMNLVWFLPYAFLKASILLLFAKYDALYLCDGLLAPLGIMLRKIFNVKTAVTVHGLDITYKNSFYQSVIPSSIAKMDRIICVSKNTLEECVKKGVERDKCVFIPNGTDVFRGNEGITLPCDIDDIITDKKTLLSVGRLVPRKGIEGFISGVFKELDDDFIYLIVGDGPERERIASVIEGNSLEGRVYMMGKVDDNVLRGLYDRAYALVMPNIEISGDPEGFGIVMLEAGAHGLPVIAYDVDGISDALQEGRTGRLIPAGDKKAFYDSIMDVDICREDIKSAIKDLDWDNITDKYIQQIEDMSQEKDTTVFSVTMAPIKPPFDDGPKNIVYGVAKRNRGNRFYMISSFSKKMPGADNIKFIRSPFQTGPHHSMPFFQKLFVFAAILMKMPSTDIFQFFFTPNRAFSRSFGKLIKARGKRSIQIVSSINTLFERNKEEDIRSLFFSDVVIAQSDHGKQRLTECGINNVKRIYPGIDLGRFDPSKERGENFYGLDAGYRYILYPGNYRLIDEAYSSDEFIRIVRSVVRDNDNARFIMACRIRSKYDREAEKRFREKAEDAGVAGSIMYMNTVENMPRLMKSCDIGILPAKMDMSRILELPLVIMEMGAMEKPFIYANVKPLDELKDKNIGIFPGDNTPEAYSSSIKIMLASKEEREKLGQASRDGVKKHFSIDSAALEYGNIYKALSRRI